MLKRLKVFDAHTSKFWSRLPNIVWRLFRKPTEIWLQRGDTIHFRCNGEYVGQMYFGGDCVLRTVGDMFRPEGREKFMPPHTAYVRVRIQELRDFIDVDVDPVE